MVAELGYGRRLPQYVYSPQCRQTYDHYHLQWVRCKRKDLPAEHFFLMRYLVLTRA